jgi:hypothetical protein
MKGGGITLPLAVAAGQRQRGQWQVQQSNGEWKRMAYLHGGGDPLQWWP